MVFTLPSNNAFNTFILSTDLTIGLFNITAKSLFSAIVLDINNISSFTAVSDSVSFARFKIALA